MSNITARTYVSSDQILTQVDKRKNNFYSIKHPQNKRAFYDGIKDGFPIGLGYFAVSFSIGVAAKNAGMTAFQGFLASILCNASAGQYVGFTLIAANAAYWEIIVATFITNARYLLMSCAMSQRLSPDIPVVHRFLMAYDVADELFGIAISRPGYLNPYYTYGAVLAAAPFWAIGTALGVIVGNMLSMKIVSALSVALFGMFLAVIIPPAKKDKVIAGLVAICFICSYASTKLPYIASISDGTRTIILTTAIASIAAIIFPKERTDT